MSAQLGTAGLAALRLPGRRRPWPVSRRASARLIARVCRLISSVARCVARGRGPGAWPHSTSPCTRLMVSRMSLMAAPDASCSVRMGRAPLLPSARGCCAAAAPAPLPLAPAGAARQQLQPAGPSKLPGPFMSRLSTSVASASTGTSSAAPRPAARLTTAMSLTMVIKFVVMVIADRGRRRSSVCAATPLTWMSSWTSRSRMAGTARQGHAGWGAALRGAAARARSRHGQAGRTASTQPRSSLCWTIQGADCCLTRSVRVQASRRNPQAVVTQVTS